MPYERKPTSLYDHDYYGPLIDSYVKSILKSGLLLDEDLEVLLSVFGVRNDCEKNTYKPSLYLLGGICAMLGSSILAKKYNLPVIALPSVIVVVTAVHSEFKCILTRKYDSKVIEMLIEATNGVQRLNLDIIHYLKIRNNSQDVNSREFFLLYSKGVEIFLRRFLRSKFLLFQNLIEALRIIAEFCDDLVDDFKCLENLDVPDTLTVHIDNDISKECIRVTERMLDLHVLLTSKLFSYAGVLFYSKRSRLHAENVTLLTNKLLPNITNSFANHLKETRENFSSLRCAANQISECIVTNTRGNAQFLRLQKSLLFSVNNLSIVLEKSQTVLERMGNSDGNDTKEIGIALENLKNHTYITFESLDLLCKLYGIIANSNTDNPNTTKINDVPQNIFNDALDDDLPVVNYDDSTEPVEEKYELYLDGESNTVEDSTTRYDDQSGAYISLVVQELKQSLRHHHRFIDMKNRRGSVEEEEDSVIAVKELPPKFNLHVLKPKSGPESVPVPPPIMQKLDEESEVNLPVPAPPPIPTFNLNDLDEELNHVHTGSMLDNIRALANQRNADVVVIGDCDSDVDSCDA